MSFDPYNHFLKIRKSIGTLTFKVGAHLGMCGFIPSHPPTFPRVWNVTLGLHSWPAPLQTFALVANPRLRLRHTKLNAKTFTIPKQCGMIINTSQCYSNKRIYKNPIIVLLQIQSYTLLLTFYFFPFLNFCCHGVFVYATLSTPLATLVAPPPWEVDNTSTSCFIDKGWTMFTLFNGISFFLPWSCCCPCQSDIELESPPPNLKPDDRITNSCDAFSNRVIVNIMKLLRVVVIVKNWTWPNIIYNKVDVINILFG